MRQNCNIKIIYDLKTIRALSLNVPNAKYLAFGTPNTKKYLSCDILNVKIFDIDEQCTLKYGNVWTDVVKF